VHNNNIENDRFSAAKKAAIIRVVAPLQSGSPQKWAEALKFEARPPCCLVMCPRTAWYSKNGQKPSRDLWSVERMCSKSQ